MAQQSEMRFRFEAVGNAGFEVVRFELTEALSQPFRLALEVSSAHDALDLDALLDIEAVFTIERDGLPVRQVHGIITAIEQRETGFRRTCYQVVVEPPLARLGLCHGSRIHQQLSVPDILSARLKERGLHARFAVAKDHLAREYCVQHRERDAVFFDRLAAEEGLVYYFDANAQSALVLTDMLVNGPRLQGTGHDTGVVRYQPNAGGDAEGPRLTRFGYRRQLAPTRVTGRDYTFRNPQYGLEHQAQARDGIGDYEHYDAPGRYKRDEAGKPFTATKLASLRRDATLAHLQGDDARLWPGVAFALTDHPSEAYNRDWRVIAMRHEGEQASSQEQDGFGAAQGSRYAYTAQAVPADTEWKPAAPPRPVMDGPQIAHVVGPPGEEIHVDEYGRVMVWFPWDRSGAKENSTCWIRVSQGSAGAGYGMVSLPRIGNEVIVSFLDGDPDQPIVTGTTYHAANVSPYKLPEHKTRSVWKSQTHKGKGSNEIRFEDMDGGQEIYVHAQRNLTAVIQADEQRTVVGGDRSITVSAGNESKTIAKGSLTERIAQARSTTANQVQMVAVAGELGEGTQNFEADDLITHVVGESKVTLKLDSVEFRHGPNSTGELKEGTQRFKAAGKITHRVGASKVILAPDSITFRHGASSILLNAEGIFIEGLVIHLNKDK